MNKKLILFTASFPYGIKENFLETELPFLSQRFEQIKVIPFGGVNDMERQVTNNCVVDKRLQCKRYQRVLHGLFGLWRVLPLYIKDFKTNKLYKDKNAFKMWLTSMLCTSFYLQSPVIRELQKQSLDDTVFYFYWGVIYNSIAPYFKGRVKMVSRFHGDWDLWKSSEQEGYKPIRKATVDSISLAALISRKGEAFFKPKYPNCPTVVSHLGSVDNGICAKSKDEVVRIVSCSTVYPLKRVPLIYESLKEVAKSKKIQWTHIGSGVDFDSLKALVNTNDSANMKVVLTGEISLTEVLSFYKTHSVDLFINLSTNEGVPVSIMEAISFNIPIVATNVGATSEIVNDETGVLVSPNPTKEEVAGAVLRVLDMKNITPRNYWEKEFNASKNYSEFAQILSNL